MFYLGLRNKNVIDYFMLQGEEDQLKTYNPTVYCMGCSLSPLCGLRFSVIYTIQKSIVNIIMLTMQHLLYIKNTKFCCFRSFILQQLHITTMNGSPASVPSVKSLELAEENILVIRSSILTCVLMSELHLNSF